MIDFFTGEETLTVDAKGRITVPQRIRRVVERGDPDWSEGKRPSLMVVYGTDDWNRLEAYSLKTYLKLIDQLRDLPDDDPDRDGLLDTYMTFAFDTQIDEEGRLTIPIRHRDRLGFGRELYLSSMGLHFRLWHRAAFEATQGRDLRDWAQARAEAPDLARKLNRIQRGR